MGALDSGLVQKFEALRRQSRSRKGVRRLREILGKALEFLRRTARLKKNAGAPDLDSLAKCRRLSRDKDLCAIDAVRKEGVRVEALFREWAARLRRGLREALEKGTPTKTAE